MDNVVAFFDRYGEFAAVFLLAVCIVLLIVLLVRQKHADEKNASSLTNSLDDLSQSVFSSIHSIMPREELTAQLNAQSQQLLAQTNELFRTELSRFDAIDARIDLFTQVQDGRIHALSASLDEKLTQSEARIEKMRETLEKSVSALQSDNGKRLDEMRRTIDEKLTQSEARIEKMRETLEKSVSNLQTENSKKLDEMRQTVDEKLHTTLEKRLSESFQVVSSQLDLVSKGLGEMRTLAAGVGDLKKVLTNVKTRGVWGEMQLGTLLEQVLTKSQYDENVAVIPGSQQRVEYAVKLPGQGDGTVYLPIDAKFPVEDYERLLSASESGDAAAIQLAQKALEDAIRTEAKRISSKYIEPPYTTDFAIMFLPVEGLYAEALRIRGLTEELQEKQRIVVAGPTTLNALLTSLQIGFRTLAIEKRSSEVWKLLSAVKTDFSRFAELLEAAQKKMRMASDSIEKATVRSRTIERKLKRVEGLDAAEAAVLLETADEADDPGTALPDETDV